MDYHYIKVTLAVLILVSVVYEDTVIGKIHIVKTQSCVHCMSGGTYLNVNSQMNIVTLTAVVISK